jgi:hypothetical protein
LVKLYLHHLHVLVVFVHKHVQLGLDISGMDITITRNQSSACKAAVSLGQPRQRLGASYQAALLVQPVLEDVRR